MKHNESEIINGARAIHKEHGINQSNALRAVRPSLYHDKCMQAA